MSLDTEFLQLPLLFDAERLRAEVEALGEEAWRPHPQGYAGNSAAILLSTNGEFNDAMAPPMRPTALLERCPYVRQVLASFGTLLGRSRLMRIAGEGRVPPHADVAYYWALRVRIHVPVVTDPRVRFVCDGRDVHMAAGEAWIFDNWRVHHVENGSDRERIHLVADTLGGAAFDELLTRARRPFAGGGDERFDPTLVPFDPNAVPSLVTETEPLPSPMPADEVDRVLDFLLNEIGRSPVDAEVAARFAERVRAFAKAWREVTSSGGESVLPRCETLLEGLRRDAAAFEGRLVLAANGIGAVRVLHAHLLDVALPSSANRTSDEDSPRREPPRRKSLRGAATVPDDVGSRGEPGREDSADRSPAALREVVDHLREGDVTSAAALVEDLVATAPNDPDVLHLAGVVALRQGRAEGAAERLRRAIELAPERAEFHGNLGVALLGLGRHREGVAALEAAVERDPDHAESHDNLGLALGRLGEIQRALAHHERAVALRPEFAAAWLHLGGARERTRDVEGAIAAYEAARRSPAHRDEASRALVGLLERAGRFDAALVVTGELAAAEPESTATLVRRGVLLARSGDHATARAEFERVLALDPDQVDGLNNLGTSLAAEGRFAEAVGRFERAVAVDPTFADGWANLARVRSRLGEHAAAAEAWERRTTLRPRDVSAHEQLGLARERIAAWEAARDAHEAALALSETRPVAWMGLARCRDHLGESDAGVAAARRAIGIAPDSADARHLLGALLARSALDRGRSRSVGDVRRRLTEAAEVLHSANDREPRASGFEVLGAVLYRLDRFEESRAALERAVALGPESAETLDALGTAELDAGRFEAAEERFRRAIASKPTLGRAHVHLLKAERNRTDDERRRRIAELESLLARSDQLVRNDRVHLHVATGLLHEELGEYDAAFDRLERGNSLKARPRRSAPFSTVVDRTISVFSREFLATHVPRGSDSTLPILVVGMPRSGTTLVEQILASHPRVNGAGELKALGLLAEESAESCDSGERYPECVPRLGAGALRRLADRYLDVLEPHRNGADRVTDKMPTNFLHLGLVALLFPGVTVIRCRRDPRDVCVSCFRQNLDWPFCDLGELGRYFVAHERLMAHWREVLPLRVHDVVYEDLVADLETHSRALVGACGLEWDERCLRFHETERAVRTPSKAQVRRPVYTSSVGRWRVYEEHLGPLLEALGSEGAP